MRLGARLFTGGCLLLAATVVGLILAADSQLKLVAPAPEGTVPRTPEEPSSATGEPKA